MLCLGLQFSGFLRALYCIQKTSYYLHLIAARALEPRAPCTFLTNILGTVYSDISIINQIETVSIRWRNSVFCAVFEELGEPLGSPLSSQGAVVLQEHINIKFLPVQINKPDAFHALCSHATAALKREDLLLPDCKIPNWSTYPSSHAQRAASTIKFCVNVPFIPVFAVDLPLFERFMSW